MGEEWRSVVGFEGLYSVSSLGRVRRDAPGSGNRGTRPGRILRPGSGRYGHKAVVLCCDGRKFDRSVHRLVAAAFIGPCPPGLHVNHKNGRPPDNRPENLEYVTCQENHRHSFRELGRRNPRGERHWNTTLTASAVRQIRKNVAAGYTHQEIANSYNVTRSSITAIVARKTWKHVD